MMRLKRVFEGLTSVAIGLIIIANSIGVLPWRVWVVILSLWPLLIVAIGIDLIGKGAKLDVLRVLSSALLLGGLIYAVASGPTGGVSWTLGYASTETFEVRSAPAPRITDASATIALPSASLDITDGSGLFYATGRLPGDKPTLDDARRGSQAELELRSPGDQVVLLFPGNAYADVELGRDKVWDLSVEAGASQGDIDLSALRLSGVRVETGVGVLDLRLGRPVPSSTGDVPVIVKAGLSDVTVGVPANVEARVEVRSGLGTVDAPDAWDRVGGEQIWESPGYANARERYLITVEGGMGIVKVEVDE